MFFVKNVEKRRKAGLCARIISLYAIETIRRRIGKGQKHGTIFRKNETRREDRPTIHYQAPDP